MANPLQPKCIKVLEVEYGAFVVNATATSKSGIMDLIVCLPRKCQGEFGEEIEGLFYGFEIKWKTDKPSEIQKKKINDVIKAGGRAYFIHSEAELRKILDEDISPSIYRLKNKVIL